MTREELRYWGVPPYTVVIEDQWGKPEGLMYTDGTFTPVGSSNIGRTINQHGVELVVVWDGAMPDKSGGGTKGRLLPINGPAYIDSLKVFSRLFKVNSDWSEIEEDGPKTAKGTSGATARKKTRNSTSRKQAPARAKQTT